MICLVIFFIKHQIHILVWPCTRYKFDLYCIFVLYCTRYWFSRSHFFHKTQDYVSSF